MLIVLFKDFSYREKLCSGENESNDFILQVASYCSLKKLQPEVIGKAVIVKYMNRTVRLLEQNGLLCIELQLPFREFYNAIEKTRKTVQHYMQSSAVDDQLVCSLSVPVSNIEEAIDSILETKVKRCVMLYEEIALNPFKAMCRNTVRMMIKQFLNETGEVIDIDVFKKDCPNPFKMDLAVAFSNYLEEVYAIRFLPENINSEGHANLDTIVKCLSVYVNQETPYVLSKRIMQ